MNEFRQTEKLIFACIADGRMQELDAALTQHPEIVLGLHSNGSTWMHIAARQEQKEALGILARHGLDIDAVDDLGYTSLDMAIISNQRLHVIEFLLEAGADPNRCYGGKPALHRAIFSLPDEVLPDAVRLMIRHGADPDVLDHNGMAPLDHAIARDKFNLATDLLSLGASVMPRGNDGSNIFEYAKFSNKEDLSGRLKAWMEAGKALRVVYSIAVDKAFARSL